MDATQVSAKVRKWLKMFQLEHSDIELPEYHEGMWLVRIFDGKRYGSVIVDDATEKVLGDLSYPLDEPF